MRAWIVVSLLAATLVAAAALYRAHPRVLLGVAYAWWHGVGIDRNVKLAMPDGTRLAMDVLRPRTQGRKLPTVLIRTPYMKEGQRVIGGDGMRFALSGFAVVVQDMRGRYASEGEFSPYGHSAEDGAATLDWIVRQPWSNGRVGAWGCSALGESQLSLAAGRHPALKAVVPLSAGGGVGRAGDVHDYFGVFEGGVMTLSSSAGWFASSGAKTPPSWRGRAISDPAMLATLPSIDVVRRLVDFPTDYEFVARTPLGDPAWDALGYLKPEDRFAVPGLHVTSWFDQASSAGIAAARVMSAQAVTREAATGQRLIIGPGTHCSTGAAAVTQVGDLPVLHGDRPLFDTWVRWLRHWLDDAALSGSESPPSSSNSDLPPVQYYVMREDAWRSADQWPPREASPRRWYLGSEGHANSRGGDGRLLPQSPTQPRSDRFDYDPMKPVPTVGGAFCCTGNPADRDGPVDQASVEARDDVLVYTSEPLDRDLRITGPVVVVAQVGTSARDTDFTAKLVDVQPDGVALNIRDGVLRLRYREGIAHPRMAEPGARYRIRIELGDIAWRVPAGDRLRLQISSSNFPRLERNLNTGGHNYDESTPVVAINQVFHGGAQPSWVEFPVLNQGLE